MDICGIIQILQTSQKSMVVLVSLKSKLEYNINGLVIDAVLSTYLSPYLSVAEAQRGEMYWMAAAVEIDSTVFAKIFSQYFQLNFCKYFQLNICCWNWRNIARHDICKNISMFPIKYLKMYFNNIHFLLSLFFTFLQILTTVQSCVIYAHYNL